MSKADKSPSGFHAPATSEEETDRLVHLKETFPSMTDEELRRFLQVSEERRRENRKIA